MISDWESMCKLAFKYRWFGTDEEREAFDIGDRKQIRWGIYFETLVFGSGLDGKTIELTKTEIESVYYDRVRRQAQIARQYLLVDMGIPLISAQTKFEHELEVDGVKIPVEMNADSLFGHGDKPELIVDTKLTGDTENTFGKWAWGAPEKMEMGQGIMYTEVVKAKFSLDQIRFKYYVADNSNKERTEIIEVHFQPFAIEEYKYGVLTVYKEVYQALLFNYFEPSPEYNKCRNCPAFNFCPHAIKTPQVTHLFKETWK